ncbi:MAG: hypothetical protein E7214_10725 [Clostridium sp.]|nr:hypothetical protein [Clostridium sp.]
MSESFKKDLINRVKIFGGDKEYWTKMKNNENSNDKNIKSKPVSSNIRSVANICNNADCYLEVRLYIEYKISKGDGWNEPVNKQKNFGQVVIDDMDSIYDDVNHDDTEALKRISLYFGYLYWQKAAIEKGKR